MKRWIALALPLGMALVASSISASAGDGGSPTYHFVSPEGVTTDSGSCGFEAPAWAIDTAINRFAVRQTGPTNFNIVIETTGTFVTIGPASPGACDTDKHHGSLVRAGVSGHFQNNNQFNVTTTTFNPNAACSSLNDCLFEIIGDGVTDATFVSFAGHYSAGDQGLVYHDWFQTADPAGDRGDIATS